MNHHDKRLLISALVAGIAALLVVEVAEAVEDQSGSSLTPGWLVLGAVLAVLSGIGLVSTVSWLVNLYKGYCEIKLDPKKWF